MATNEWVNLITESEGLCEHGSLTELQKKMDEVKAKQNELSKCNDNALISKYAEPLENCERLLDNRIAELRRPRKGM